MTSVIYYFGTIYIPLLLSLAVHEYAHAYAAYRLGDDTAKHLGRLSLNPFSHIDMIGTVILPFCGIPFGWAKPVPFNPQRFKINVPMNLGTALVALAGPVSNFILALICVFALQVFEHSQSPVIVSLHSLFEKLFRINIVLGLFNLLPIPPLDGGHITNYFMPKFLKPIWDPIYTSGPIILLIGFIFFGWYVRLVFNYF